MVRTKRSQTDPAHWEKVLESVTVKPKKNEILMDPYLMDTLLVSHSPNYLKTLMEDSKFEEERNKQIEKLQSIAQSKLEDRQRECILLLLSGIDSYSQIGEMIGISRDTVRREIEEAVDIIKAHLGKSRHQVFPSARTQKLKTAILPVDTDDEQKKFQRFINKNKICHLALSNNYFREVLVVYEC